jgi:enamine deaminase RidA (YjgF/YER057c/UK114 family)
MRKIVSTRQAPNPIGPYSQAIRGGQVLLVSGQIPVDLPRSLSLKATFVNRLPF